MQCRRLIGEWRERKLGSEWSEIGMGKKNSTTCNDSVFRVMANILYSANNPFGKTFRFRIPQISQPGTATTKKEKPTTEAKSEIL